MQKKGVHLTDVDQVGFGASPIHGHLRLCALSLSFGGATASAFVDPLALPRLGQNCSSSTGFSMFSPHTKLF